MDAMTVTGKILGVTDQPRSAKNKEDDLLNTDAYAEGLCAFISQCPTPMSVALQGDWGSGKSSFLEHIQDTLKGQGFKVIQVNTWQYSHLGGGSQLASIFLTSLLNAMELKEVTLKKTLEAAWKLGKVGLNAVGMAGVAAAVDEAAQVRDIKLIENLRQSFENSVKACLGNPPLKKDRIIVLVDDLDRLDPNAAVELLESIKLFMDVEGCVFVLAIDYDVVVQGVRAKFGANIPLEKCRSFFDKIIQLPFHMPVESYSMENMIRKYLGEHLPSSCIGKISEFAAETAGANPRSIKRMVNSFLLLAIIQGKLHSGENAAGSEENSSKEENALLFCVLCIQAHYMPLYTYLSDTDEWEAWEDGFVVIGETPADRRETLRTRLQPYSDEDFKDERVLDRMTKALAGLDEILELFYPKADKRRKQEPTAYEHLENVLRLSAVTGTGNALPKNASKGNAVPVKVVIDGIETSYPAAVTAVQAAAAELLKRYPERIADCLREYNFLTDDPNRNNSVFRRKEEIACFPGDTTKKVYLGLSTGNPAKRQQLRRLCRFLNLKSGYLRWEDDTGSYNLSDN